MEYRIEQQLELPNVTVQIATVTWQGVEETPAYTGYSLSQRLSEDHSPLRIGNLSAPAVLPRVKSVGLLPPGRPIRMLPVESALRVLLCVFDEAYFERVTQTNRQQWEDHIGALVAMKNQRLEVLMQEIHAELEQPGFAGEQLISAVCDMMLVELARQIRQYQRRDAGGSDVLGLASWQLRRIQERMADASESGYPNLAELAALCGVSEGHLTRSFKATTGWQLHRYITEQRFEAAKLMLRDGDSSCEQIAARLGFKSAAYFSTAFRRETGKTPTEYRRQAHAVRDQQHRQC